MADPRINLYDPNEINYTCDFNFTTATVENAPFLYDNDIMTVLSSDGSADGVQEKWVITFASSRPSNFIGIFNHNIKNGYIKYLNSSLVETDFSTPIVFTNNTSTSNVFTYTDPIAYGVVISCTNTIDATEKTCGEFRVLNKFADLPAPSTVKPNLVIEQNLKKKYDGGKNKVIDGIKFMATIDWKNLADADVATIRDLATRGRHFYISLSDLSSAKSKLFYRLEDQFPVNMTSNPSPEAPDGQIDGVFWKDQIKVEEI